MREPRRNGDPGEECDGHDLTMRARAGRTLTAACGYARGGEPTERAQPPCRTVPPLPVTVHAWPPQNSRRRRRSARHPGAPAGRRRRRPRATTRRPTSAASVRRLHAYLPPTLPVPVPDHDRRQRQHRRHVADRGRALADELPGVAALPARARRAAAARCAPCGRRATRRSLAYMDVDLSTDLDALLPLVAPLLSGHSDLAIGTRLARSVARRARRRSASSSRAATTCSCATTLRGPLHRRAVRLQGDPRRRARAQLLPLVEDERLVLRHRAAGARRAHRAAHPRGARSTGSTTPTAASTSSRTAARRPPRRRAHGPRPRHRARCRSRSCGAARPRPTPAERPTSAGQVARASASIGVASTLAYLAARTCSSGRALGAQARQRRRAAAHRASPTPRPTAGSRSASAAAPAPCATSCRAWSCSARPGADQRLAGAARRARAGASRGTELAVLVAANLARDRRCASCSLRAWVFRRRRRRRPTDAVRIDPRARIRPSMTPPLGAPTRDDRADGPGAAPSPSRWRAAGPSDPALGAARAARPARRHRGALPVGPRRLRLGQRLLLRRGPGRARRAGRRSSSARSTPSTPSPSTSRRRRCG